MIIALTGATGFVGQAVLDKAAALGWTVRALTRREQKPRDGVEWVRGDLADKDALTALATGADAVLHVAGVVNAPDAAGFHKGNVQGTQEMVAAAKRAGCTRFVAVSSLSAREPGLSLYGMSKREGEQPVRTSGLAWTIVRPPAIYGPRDKEILELFKAAKWGFVPMPPAGRASMIHVDDLATLLLALCRTTDERVLSQTFEVDDAVPGGWSHADLGTAIGAAIGKPVKVVQVPAKLMQFAAKADGFLRGKGAKLTPDRVAYMVHPDWVSRPSMAVPHDIWTPAIETRQGLADTAQWYRQNKWL